MDISKESVLDYKIISISPVCNGGNPCIHGVTLECNNTIIEGFLNGAMIADYFNKHNEDIPIHYNKYFSKYSN
jgi:hypothetical protein